MDQDRAGQDGTATGAGPLPEPGVGEAPLAPDPLAPGTPSVPDPLAPDPVPPAGRHVAEEPVVEAPLVQAPPASAPATTAAAAAPAAAGAATSTALMDRPDDDDVPVPPDEDDRVVVTRADWLRALKYSALVYLGVRLGLFLVGLLSTALLPRNNPVDVPGWPATQPSESWHNVFTAWERHDVLWFLRIASTGYRQDDASAAFFPLYPLLSRGLANLVGNNWLLGAYLASNLSLIVGLTVLYRLTSLEWGDSTARRTVLYLAVFPTALFLFAPYTESLFLALSVGCLYAARRSAWLLAGYLGAMSSLTRSTGLLLVLPLAVEALLQYRVHRKVPQLLAGLLASASVTLGIGAYFLYWRGFAGDWRRPLDVQGSNWSREKSWPWETIQAGAREGTRYFGQYAGGYHSVDLVLVAVALVAGVWILLRMRLTYSLYYWAALLFPMTLAFGGRPFLSMPRFLLVMVPLFWALARLSERYKVHDAVVATSACGLGLLSILYVNWYFIF